MNILRYATLAMVLAAAPKTLEAQDGWWDWNLRELSVRVDLHRSPGLRYVPEVVYTHGPRFPYRVEAPRRRARARKGPAFCRSGAGHPVFGRRWCLDKGFGLGGPGADRFRWERRYWQDVLPRHRRRHLPAVLGRRELIDVLGPAGYRRLERERARLGGRSALSGRWIRPRGTFLVLQVRSGPLAVAEFTDVGADGLIDVVFVAGG